MAIIQTGWSDSSGNIGAVLSNKDSERFYSLPISTINSLLNSNLPPQCRITNITINATASVENSALGKYYCEVGYGGEGSISEWLNNVGNDSSALKWSSGISANLNAVINGRQLSTNKGGYITYRVFSYDWGKKTYKIDSVYLDVTYETPFTITVSSNNNSYGTVSGGGSYYNGSTATLTATANTGYRFKQWQDGNTDNPRSVTVSGNATYTAEFEKTTFTISGTVSPANSGTVDGAKAYTYGDTATLTAIPNEGYDFVKWSDGVTDNPRTFTVTGAATFVAEFKLKTFVVSVRADTGFKGVQLGTATGAGVYEYGQQAILAATPLVEGWLKFEFFYSESPEDYDAIYKDNPFIFTVTNNRNLCAKFAYIGQPIELRLPANDYNNYNSTFYHRIDLLYKRPIELPEPPVKEDTDQYHYEFDGWYSMGESGDKLTADIIGYDTPIEITSYIARFTRTLRKYVVTTVATKGSITGVESGSSYEYGTTLTLTAVPNDRCKFKYWADDPTNTNPVRTVTVTGEATYEAVFEYTPPEIVSVTITRSIDLAKVTIDTPVDAGSKYIISVEVT